MPLFDDIFGGLEISLEDLAELVRARWLSEDVDTTEIASFDRRAIAEQIMNSSVGGNSHYVRLPWLTKGVYFENDGLLFRCDDRLKPSILAASPNPAQTPSNYGADMARMYARPFPVYARAMVAQFQLLNDQESQLVWEAPLALVAALEGADEFLPEVPFQRRREMAVAIVRGLLVSETLDLGNGHAPKTVVRLSFDGARPLDAIRSAFADAATVAVPLDLLRRLEPDDAEYFSRLHPRVQRREFENQLAGIVETSPDELRKLMPGEPGAARQRDAFKLLCEMVVMRRVFEGPNFDGVEVDISPSRPSDLMPGFCGNSGNFQSVLNARSGRLRLSHYKSEVSTFLEALRGRAEFEAELELSVDEFNKQVDELAEAVLSPDRDDLLEPEMFGMATVVREWVSQNFPTAIKSAPHHKSIPSGRKFDPGPLLGL